MSLSLIGRIGAMFRKYFELRKFGKRTASSSLSINGEASEDTFRVLGGATWGHERQRFE
jgi:hypothetical protein